MADRRAHDPSLDTKLDDRNYESHSTLALL
jgi:hypothetical protein